MSGGTRYTLSILPPSDILVTVGGAITAPVYYRAELLRFKSLVVRHLCCQLKLTESLNPSHTNNAGP